MSLESIIAKLQDRQHGPPTNDRMVKSGPFIGPRGGLWADSQHKIPWKARTGVINVPHAVVAATADRLVPEVAESTGIDTNTSALHGKTTTAKFDGEKINFVVSTHEGGFEGGFGHQKTTGEPVVVLFVPIGLKTSREHVASEFRRIIAHEVTHAKDPGRRGGQDKEVSAGEGYSEYINSKEEVAAHLQEIYRDLNAPSAVKRLKLTKDPIMWARMASPTFREIWSELTPENKQRVGKVVGGHYQNVSEGRTSPIDKSLMPELASQSSGMENRNVTGTGMNFVIGLKPHETAKPADPIPVIQLVDGPRGPRVVTDIDLVGLAGGQPKGTHPVVIPAQYSEMHEAVRATIPDVKAGLNALVEHRAKTSQTNYADVKTPENRDKSGQKKKKRKKKIDSGEDADKTPEDKDT